MSIERYIIEIVPYIASLIEIVGVLIIAWACIQTVKLLIKSRFDTSNAHIKLELAKALALALEYKMAAEVLKTVVIRTLDEIFILSADIVLRVILTGVIHWEIKVASEDEEKAQRLAILSEKKEPEEAL